MRKIQPRKELMFLERNMEYYKRHGRGLVQDLLENELHENERIVQTIGNFVAFCPFASGFPFEVMIAPKINMTSLSECSRDDISDLSVLINELFKRMNHQLGEFDYNLYITLAPLNGNFENESYLAHLHKNFRFIIRIVPRIYTIGGFEISTSMMINPVPPEECAKLLRTKGLE